MAGCRRRVLRTIECASRRSKERTNMKNKHYTGFALLGALASVALVGCTTEVNPPDSTTTVIHDRPAPPTVIHDKPSTVVVTPPANPPTHTETHTNTTTPPDGGPPTTSTTTTTG